MVRSFFLLIHFLVVEDYELRKRTVLIHLFFFYCNCFPDVILCKIAIWGDDTALNSPYDKPSELLLYEKYQKMQFCIQLYIHICKIIPYFQANPYQIKIKIKNINSLIFIRVTIKWCLISYTIIS